MKKKNQTALIIFAIIGSIVAAFVANRAAAIALSLSGDPLLNINTALQTVFTDIQHKPFYISTDQQAFDCFRNSMYCCMARSSLPHIQRR